MAFDFLIPVSEKVLAFSEFLPPQSLGKNTFKHTEKKGLPVFANATVAIFGVLESRNAFEKKPEKLDIDAIRIQLYRLMMGNWNSNIIDIGDVAPGETVEDTYFVVREIVAGLLEENIVPIVIGATQDITFATYRAFDAIKEMINVVNIDSRFDFGEDDELISSESYMSRIITDKPNNLHNFSNLGYQSYFNAQEEIDLMERLFFDAYRLGEITNDITLAEPVLRNAHLVSLDMRAVRASEMGVTTDFSPNGFDGREICAIARYAGISDKVAVFGIYEMANTSLSAQLVAQIIWYFIEGLSFRVKEFPTANDEDFTKFTVPTDTEELIFFKSHLTQRWWVEVPSILPEHTKTNSIALLPCTQQDYLDACNQNIPERWLKAYKKGFN
ncbi:Arginase/agmatinase/formiminoglutamase [Croceitalea dokdonensis DOKDO 023]|uniref:Arginase/agmatinase/formiminoglutamase n=1 Tax=Croceitalea dokdonensis DOKDO 023 TaxID=1300341 RepID=A0A0P7B2S7_9FLAO|nr:formimidoylglutamase [Croceitalea dokdonensis]KPM32625.1 Arginase/agmatinase/formiminoglutamase [Croceitalea dokdonensis DOKDO 023]